ncbi:MAG TPA: glutathione S-transferase, partial [Geminicoccaceae bacterium]
MSDGASPVLVIGNKNYSSWSLRAWIALKLSGLAFEEILVRLSTPESGDELRRRSPSGRVPVLIHGDLVIPESLAIIEYAAELAPGAGLWPEDRAARAEARAVAAEMHAGFQALRHHLPMNLRRRRAPVTIDGVVADDIARITEIFR